MTAFTAAEDAVIVELYSKATLHEIGVKLDRPWTAIQGRTYTLIRHGRLDRNARFHNRPWTVHEEQTLRGLWGWHTERIVAQKLGRSVNSVHLKARRLGFTMAWKGAYTASDVGKLFAVDAKTVSHIWIEHGWLAAKRSDVKCGRNRKWRITHEAIEAFIRAYPMYYERRRISEPYWREIADKVAESFDLVPLRVAASILGCTDETLKRRIRRGLWPAEQVVCGGGFAWMVRRADLATFEYLHPPVRLEYAKGRCGALPRSEAVV